MDGIKIVPAEPRDAMELLALQRIAFASEAMLYNEPLLPPMVQTLAELETELATTLCLKATDQFRIVGAIRLTVEGSMAEIRRLVVDPAYQGRGIGRLLMQQIEAAAPADVDQFTLFTGHLSLPTIRLYEGLGYQKERRQRLNDSLTLVHMSKELRSKPKPAS